jgi:hypothetical protein
MHAYMQWCMHAYMQWCMHAYMQWCMHEAIHISVGQFPHHKTTNGGFDLIMHVCITFWFMAMASKPICDKESALIQICLIMLILFWRIESLIGEMDGCSSSTEPWWFDQRDGWMARLLLDLWTMMTWSERWMDCSSTSDLWAMMIWSERQWDGPRVCRSSQI